MPRVSIVMLKVSGRMLWVVGVTARAFAVRRLGSMRTLRVTWPMPMVLRAMLRATVLGPWDEYAHAEGYCHAGGWRQQSRGGEWDAGERELQPCRGLLVSGRRRLRTR